MRKRPPPAGLETCRPHPRKIAHAQPKNENFLKRTYQEGRIPLRRWPARSFVTIPYTRIICLYTTLPDAQASPHVERTQTLEIGDSLRISEPLQTRKPGLQLFFVPASTVLWVCRSVLSLSAAYGGWLRSPPSTKSVDGGRGDAAAPRRGDPHAGLRASPLHFGGTPSPAPTGRSALRLVWRNGRFRGINGQKVRPPVLIPPIVPAVSRGRL